MARVWRAERGRDPQRIAGAELGRTAGTGCRSAATREALAPHGTLRALAPPEDLRTMVTNVFLGLLGVMVVAAGLFSIVVVARLVEPRGVRALLRRLAGR